MKVGSISTHGLEREYMWNFGQWPSCFSSRASRPTGLLFICLCMYSIGSQREWRSVPLSRRQLVLEQNGWNIVSGWNIRDACCRHVTLVTRIITGSYVTTLRKPQFYEEDPWSRVKSSKFRPMFAGVNVSFHQYCAFYAHLWHMPCTWICFQGFL